MSSPKLSNSTNINLTISQEPSLSPKSKTTTLNPPLSSLFHPVSTSNNSQNQITDYPMQLTSENFLKIENELQKSKLEIARLESTIQKLQSQISSNSIGSNNTSNTFLLSSEFKKDWTILGSELIMESFENVFNRSVLLCYMVQETFKLTYQETENLIKNKIMQIKNLLNISESECNNDNFLTKIKPLFIEYFSNVFQIDNNKNENNIQYVNNILNKLKNIIYKIQIAKYFYKEITLDIESENIKKFINKSLKLCLFMQLHNPKLLISIDNNLCDKKNLNYYYYDKTNFINIEGFAKDNSPCLIILPPPMLNKNYAFQGLKPFVYIISDPDEKIMECCENNRIREEKKILNRSKSYDCESFINKNISSNNSNSNLNSKITDNQNNNINNKCINCLSSSDISINNVSNNLIGDKSKSNININTSCISNGENIERVQFGNNENYINSNNNVIIVNPNILNNLNNLNNVNINCNVNQGKSSKQMITSSSSNLIQKTNLITLDKNEEMKNFLSKQPMIDVDSNIKLTSNKKEKQRDEVCLSSNKKDLSVVSNNSNKKYSKNNDNNLYSNIKNIDKFISLASSKYNKNNINIKDNQEKKESNVITISKNDDDIQEKILKQINQNIMNNTNNCNIINKINISPSTNLNANINLYKNKETVNDSNPFHQKNNSSDRANFSSTMQTNTSTISKIKHNKNYFLPSDSQKFSLNTNNNINNYNNQKISLTTNNIYTSNNEQNIKPKNNALANRIYKRGEYNIASAGNRIKEKNTNANSNVNNNNSKFNVNGKITFCNFSTNGKKNDINAKTSKKNEGNTNNIKSKRKEIKENSLSTRNIRLSDKYSIKYNYNNGLKENNCIIRNHVNNPNQSKKSPNSNTNVCNIKNKLGDNKENEYENIFTNSGYNNSNISNSNSNYNNSNNIVVPDLNVKMINQLISNSVNNIDSTNLQKENNSNSYRANITNITNLSPFLDKNINQIIPIESSQINSSTNIIDNNIQSNCFDNNSQISSNTQNLNKPSINNLNNINTNFPQRDRIEDYCQSLNSQTKNFSKTNKISKIETTSVSSNMNTNNNINQLSNSPGSLLFNKSSSRLDKSKNSKSKGKFTSNLNIHQTTNKNNNKIFNIKTAFNTNESALLNDNKKSVVYNTVHTKNNSTSLSVNKRKNSHMKIVDNLLTGNSKSNNVNYILNTNANSNCNQLNTTYNNKENKGTSNNNYYYPNDLFKYKTYITKSESSISVPNGNNEPLINKKGNNLSSRILSYIDPTVLVTVNKNNNQNAMGNNNCFASNYSNKKHLIDK